VTVLKRSIPIIASWSGVTGWELASRTIYPNEKKDPATLGAAHHHHYSGYLKTAHGLHMTPSSPNAGGQWGSTGEVSQHSYIPTHHPRGNLSVPLLLVKAETSRQEIIM